MRARVWQTAARAHGKAYLPPVWLDAVRTIYLPATLVSEIEQTGYFFKYSPNKLAEHLHIYQDKLNIPRFRFHDLRHYFASYASTIMPESDAMALGGWKSDFVFKQIYRESMKDKRKASAELFNNSIFN